MTGRVLSVSQTDPSCFPTISEALAVAGAGVTVVVQPAPVIERCQVTGALDAGLLFQDEARAALAGVTVRGGRIGLLVRGSARPIVNCGRITGCAKYGVEVLDQAEGRLGQVEVEQCASGAVRVAGGMLGLVESTLRGGSAGLRLVDGAAVLRSCEVRDTADAGLLIEAGGDLTLLHSRVLRCGGAGVRFAAQSTGLVDECEVLDNAGDGVLVETTRPVRVHATSLRGNQGEPVRQAVPTGALEVTASDGVPAALVPPGPVPPSPSRDSAGQPVTDGATTPTPADALEPSGARGEAVTPQPDLVAPLLAQLEALVGLASSTRWRRSSVCSGSHSAGLPPGCPRRRCRGTWFSRARRAPERPPWPGCTGRSSPRSACCRPGSWSRCPAPIWWPSTSAVPR
jgi:hypothetical protein